MIFYGYNKRFLLPVQFSFNSICVCVYMRVCMCVLLLTFSIAMDLYGNAFNINVIWHSSHPNLHKMRVMCCALSNFEDNLHVGLV